MRLSLFVSFPCECVYVPEMFPSFPSRVSCLHLTCHDPTYRPDQRLLCIEKAFDLLVTHGVLFVVTPRSTAKKADKLKGIVHGQGAPVSLHLPAHLMCVLVL